MNDKLSITGKVTDGKGHGLAVVPVVLRLPSPANTPDLAREFPKVGLTDTNGSYLFDVPAPPTVNSYEVEIRLNKLVVPVDPPDQMPVWELVTEDTIPVQVEADVTVQPAVPRTDPPTIPDTVYQPSFVGQLLKQVKTNIDNQLTGVSGEITGVKDEVNVVGRRVGSVADKLPPPETVDDITSFPFLTEEVGYPSSPSAAPSRAPGGAPSGGSLGQTVEVALRDVLGWKLKRDDPKGFIGALTQSFTCKEVEGHTECTWVPRSYAVQTDLAGGITGAQASIYSRTKEALDQSLPLLDGLYPLRVDADPDDVIALRALARGQMTELVNELGLAGGPRVTRVDQLFVILLGDFRRPPAPPARTIETDPDQIGGQLGTLRDEFGLWSVVAPPGQEVLINTVEEEQNVTNFRILVDYLVSLRQSWELNRGFFDPSSQQQPFFGTQLVLLSRTLSVVAELVDEVRFTLDSVFIGPSERQTLLITFPPQVTLPALGPGSIRPRPVPPGAAEPVPLNDPNVNSDALFLEDLLSWVSGFATEEGPRLIQDGGKFAVQTSFLPVVVNLRNLVFGATIDQNPAPDSLPRGYKTRRVQRAVEKLAEQLDGLAVLANQIKHTIPSQNVAQRQRP